VLDGVGIGEQPDAAEYGDRGSDTLAHVCKSVRPRLPHLAALGLGGIAPLTGVPFVETPGASYGKMREVSAGKDSTTGHWELAGLLLDQPFPTYPKGFPADLIATFQAQTGCLGILGNRPASGTAIIEAVGADLLATGWPIGCTSADSVFQIAAHTEALPLQKLYELCQTTRDRVCVGEHAVGRVIARPFEGTDGSFLRLSAHRKDYSLRPVRDPLQRTLQQAGIRTVSIGKVADLFGNLGFDEEIKTKSNADGIERTLATMKVCAQDGIPTFVWVNLVDFDQEFGHRNDPAGFGKALESFDARLPELMEVLPADGVLVITADHGNDPTTPSTDHSREYVPVLQFAPGKPAKPLGTRETFADHAATVARYFGLSVERGAAF
jgi:phosphopentomutase